MTVKTIKELPDDLLSEYFYTFKTDGKLSPQHDIDLLCQLTAIQNPKYALEIGTDKGYGTLAIASNMKDGILYTIDKAGDGTFCKDSEIGIMVKKLKNVNFLRGDCRFYDYRKAGLKECNLAFIDGSHDLNNVIIDTYKVLDLTTYGDMIIWHDYNSPYKTDYVTEAIDKLCDLLPGQVYHIEGSWIAYTIRGEY